MVRITFLSVTNENRGTNRPLVAVLVHSHRGCAVLVAVVSQRRLENHISDEQRRALRTGEHRSCMGVSQKHLPVHHGGSRAGFPLPQWSIKAWLGNAVTLEKWNPVPRAKRELTKCVLSR